jgi:hypothetical protein
MPIWSLFVSATLLSRVCGAVGTVKITAPLPATEKSDVPTILVADTLAKMLEPHSKLYGSALSDSIETVH